MSAAASVSRPASSVAAALAPIMIAVLTGFLVIGAALPVLPLHVHGLGFGPAMIGAVSGCQFAASLLARFWSGRLADMRGPKWAVMLGLAGTTAAVATAIADGYRLIDTAAAYFKEGQVGEGIRNSGRYVR